MKIVCVSNSVKEQVTKKILAEENTKALSDIVFIPLFQWLQSKITMIDSETEIMMKAYHKIKEVDVELLKPLLNYPVFIQEIISFVKECKQLSIDCDFLPERNKQEIELKKMIKKCMEVSFIEEKYNEVLSTIDESDIYLYCTSMDTVFKKRIVDTLLQRGAVIIEEKHDCKQSLYYALTYREEIEAIAQDIIKKGYDAKDVSLVCLQPEKQYGLIKQVFHRYNIPFTIINETVMNRCVLALQASYTLFKEGNSGSIAQCMAYGLLPYHSAVYDFLSRFSIPFSQLCTKESVLVFNDSLHPYEIETLRKKEETVFSYMEEHRSTIESLLSLQSISDVIVRSYEMMIQSSSFSKEELMAIKGKIEDGISYIIDEQSFQFWLELCDQGVTLKQSVGTSVLVTDSKTKILARDIAYVLGVDEKHYPGFKGRSGLFDESYVENSGYPSLKERIDVHKKDMDWILTCGKKEINFSYAESDGLGKQIECSLEMEMMFNKARKYEVQSYDQYYYRSHFISEEVAQSLFFKDDVLQTSISALERYAKCEYHYFLVDGLKLKRDEEIEIDRRTLGNLQHTIMEKLVNQKGKKYCDVAVEEIKLLSDDYFEQMKVLHPTKKQTIDCIQCQLLDSIKSKLEVLADMEKYTTLIPTHCELKYEEIINNKVRLKGIIDRIDENAEGVRIVDYKTTKKELSNPSINALESIQLLYYAVIYHRITNKKVIGVNIIGLDNPKFSLSEFNVSRGKMEEISEEKIKEKMKSGHKLNGKIFYKADGLDMSGSYVQGVSIKKDGLSYKTIDFDIVEQWFEKSIDYFYESIKQGNIRLNPSKGALAYSDLDSILRFRGIERKSQSIVPLEVKADEVE